MGIYDEFIAFFSLNKHAKSKQIITPVDEGPIGRFDSYQSFALEGEAPWYVATWVTTSPAQYVIYSDPFLQYRSASTFEPELWQKWIEHHALYPWTGKLNSMTDLVSLHDRHQLRQSNLPMPNASQEDMRLSIQRVGLNPKQFIFVDVENYYRFLREKILNSAKERGFSKNDKLALSIEDLTILYIADHILGIKSSEEEDVPFYISKELEEKVNLYTQQHQPRVEQPLSTQSLSLSIETPLELKAMVDNLHTLRSLKHLDLHVGTPLNKIDLSQLNLHSLRVVSKTSVEFVALPLTLQSLEVDCEKLEIPELHQHSELKKVSLSGYIHFIEHLPYSLEFLELRNSQDPYGSERSVDLKDYINLRHLALIDCRNISKVKGLSKSLKCLIISKCFSLNRLHLNGLTDLVHLELLYLGTDLRIYSDDELTSVAYFNAVGIKSAQSFTDEELRMDKILSQTALANVVSYTKKFNKIEDIIARLRTCQHINLSNLNSQQIQISATAQRIQISDCEELTSLKTNSDNKNVVLRNCRKLETPQATQQEMSSSQALRLAGSMSPDVSSLGYLDVEIVDGMLMDKSFYPASLRKLTVRNSCAWKFKLDAKKFDQLETLVLENVDDLVVIENLPSSLKHLEIHHCKNLKAIDFNHLKHLDHLSLVGLDKQLIILNIEQLSSINYLMINSVCDHHFKMAELISHLDQCVELIVRNNNVALLRSLPKQCQSITFEYCSTIESLNFSGVNGLKNLVIEHCHRLQFLRSLPSDLERMVVRYNYELRNPNISHLENLKEVSLYLNRSDLNITIHTLLEESTPEQIEQRIKEKDLSLSEEGKAKGYCSPEELEHLERALPTTSKEAKLDRLYLKGRVFVPDLSHDEQLEDLTLSNIYLRDTRHLPKRLKTLTVANSYGKVDLRHLSPETQLIVDSTNQDIHISALAEHVGPIIVKCYHHKVTLSFEKVISIQSLTVLGSLENLEVIHSEFITETKEFRLNSPGEKEEKKEARNQDVQLNKIVRQCQSIIIEYANHISALNFNDIEELKHVRIEHCHGLSQIYGLPEFLDRLELRYNYRLKTPDLSHLTTLKEACIYLNASEVSHDIYKPLPPNEQLELELKNLDLNRIQEGEENGFLTAIENLKHSTQEETKLDRFFLNGLTIVPDISSYTQIESLTLSKMYLSDTRHLPSGLKQLRLVDCQSNNSGLDFSNLRELTSLTIQGKNVKLIISRLPEKIENISLDIYSGALSISFLDVKCIQRLSITGIDTISLNDFSDDIEIQYLYLRSKYLFGLYNLIRSCKFGHIELVGINVDQGLSFNECTRGLTFDNCRITQVNLENINSLKKYEIFNSEIPYSALDKLPTTLETLQLRGNKSRVTPNLVGLHSLRTVNITQTPGDNKKESFDENSQIIILDSTHRNGDCVIPDLSPFVHLKVLHLHNMLLGDLSQLPSGLKEIKIDNCYTQYPDINFQSLKLLESIEINFTPNIRSIAGFGGDLKKLRIIGNHDLKTIDLSNTRIIDRLALTYSHVICVKYHTDLCVNVLEIDSQALQSDSVKKLVKSPLVPDLTFMCSTDGNDIPNDICEKIETLSIYSNNKIQGRFSLSKFRKLKGLIINETHLMTALMNFPSTLRSLQLNRNFCLKIDLSDPALETLLEQPVISECDRIDTENPQFQEGLKKCVSDYDKVEYVKKCVTSNMPFVKKGININTKQHLQSLKEQERIDKLIRDLTTKFGNNYVIDGWGNHNSDNVERLIIQSEAKPDNATGFPIVMIEKINAQSSTAATHPDECLVMAYDLRGKISRSHFRFNAYNTIAYQAVSRALSFQHQLKRPETQSLISLAKPLTNTTVDELLVFVRQNKEWAMCYSDLNLKAGQKFTLITTPISDYTKQLVIFCNEAEQLDLIIDHDEQKVSVTLKPGIPNLSVKIAHRFLIQDNYLIQNTTDLNEVVISKNPILTPALQKEIQQVLESDPELRVLLNSSTLALADKLAYLYTLCQNFTQEDSDKAKTIGTIDAIFDNLINKRGVCRHRSEIFMLIANYFNVPFTMFGNGKHRFGEMSINKQGNIVRMGLDFGGGVAITLVSRKAIENALRDEKSIIENKAKQVAEEKARKDAEEKARIEAQEKIKKEAEEKAKKEAEEKLRKETEERERKEAEDKLKKAPLEEARRDLEEKLKQETLALKDLEAVLTDKAKAQKSWDSLFEAKSQCETELPSKTDAVNTASIQLTSEIAKEEAASIQVNSANKALELANAKLIEAGEAKVKAERKLKKLLQLFPPQEELSSILPLLDEDAPHAPLLRLPSNLNPLQVYMSIRAELEAHDDLKWPKQFLYIHDPKDMKRYFKSILISGGERRFVPGPLVTHLDRGGILIINWTQFSDDQKAYYMSILEPKGTLLGHEVCASLKIFSLIMDSAPIGIRAFLSRTKPYKLNENYVVKSPKKPQEEPSAEFLTIDLHYLPNWRERLITKVLRENQGYYLPNDGALLRAICEGKNLRIDNLPESESIVKFLERLEVEGEFFHNNEFVKLPPNFVIRTGTREQRLHSDNVSLLTHLSEDAVPGHFLNSNNLFECFSRQVVNNRLQCVLPAPGWFESCNHFYITETITQGEWCELIEHASLFSERHFTFTLLAGGEIQNFATHNSAASPESENSQIVYSSDPDFCALRLQEEKYPGAIIVDVNPNMTYQQLLARLHDKRTTEGKALFSYEPHAVLYGLINGATIILNGQVSPLLYQQLLPFLYPKISRVFQNGLEVEPEGRLICVIPSKGQEQLRLEDQEIVKKIELLFHFAQQLNHHDLGQPPLPVLTNRRLKAMIARLNDQSLRLIHRENPIKGLFNYDYPKQSENYAFLNVVAKYLFGPADDDSEKYRHVKCEPLSDWQVMNHCSGSTLRKLLGEPLEKAIKFKHGKAILCDETLVSTVRHRLSKAPTKTSTTYKPSENFKTLVKSENTIAIFQKGLPGTSKSHELRELQKTLGPGHFFRGLSQCSRWLATKPVNEQPVIINLEEVNMLAPGMLDRFKGMTRDNRLMYEEGKYYVPTPLHKILGNGNPETFPNRYFHSFLSEYSETVFYTLPHDESIKHQIIVPILDDSKLNIPNKDEVIERLLLAFHHMKKFEAHREISLRDIISLVKRFVLIYRQLQNIEEAIQKTLWHEFGHSIRDAQKREEYKRFLGIVEHPQDEIEVFEVKHLLIPNTKYPMVEMNQEDLRICDMSAKTSHRRGVIVEGPSGIGKSSLYKALLDLNGFTKNNPDPQFRYYEISVDDGDHAIRMCLKAYFNGSKIILDEFNSRLEELLNDLMEGVLPDQPYYTEIIQEIMGENPVILPGFFVCASLNPGQTISNALLNRFHCIHADNYTDEELLAILRKATVPDPEDVLTQFNEARAKNPDEYNPRKFFEWMRTPEALRSRTNTAEEEKLRLAIAEEAKAKEHKECCEQEVMRTTHELEVAQRLRALAEQRLEAEKNSLTDAKHAREKIISEQEGATTEIGISTEKELQARTHLQECMRARETAEVKVKTVEENIRIAAEKQAKLEAEEKARIAAAEQAKLEAEENARIAAIKQAKLEAEEKARIAAAEQAKQKTEEITSSESEQDSMTEDQENSESEEKTQDQTNENDSTETSNTAINYIEQLKQKYTQHQKWNAYSRSKPSIDDFDHLKHLQDLKLNTLSQEFSDENGVKQGLLNLLAYTAKLASESPSFFNKRNKHRKEKIEALIAFFNELPSNENDFNQHIEDALTNEKLTRNRTTGFFKAYGRKVGKRNTVGKKSNHHWIQSTTEELLYEIQKANENNISAQESSDTASSSKSP